MLLYWTPIVAFLVLTVLAVELEGLSLGWQLVVWTAAVVLVAVADAAAHRTSPESARTRQPAGRRARSADPRSRTYLDLRCRPRLAGGCSRVSHQELKASEPA